MVKIKELKIDEDIYPRKNLNQSTIESYVEALESGAEFPKIIIQKIKIDDKEIKIILDGAHRFEAHKKAKIEDIKEEYYKKEVLDKEEFLNELRIESIRLNLEHGDRLKNDDKEEMCRIMAEEDEEIKFTEESFAKIFGVVRQSINNWIGDIRARQKGSRNNLIFTLSRLGFKQQEIADIVRLSQMQISDILKILPNLAKSLNLSKSAIELAEYNGFSLPLTWSLIVDGMNDLEIFKTFGREEYGNSQPRMSDYWKFVKGDLRLGRDYEGRLWCQDVMNILYRFSKQGDLVVDAMAGGATVSDTCLLMKRKCRSYDIKPIRKEIIELDIRDGFPKEVKGCDLILFDPPYYKKKEYSNPELMEDRKTFLNFIKKFAEDSFNTLNKGGYMVLVFSQYIDYDNEKQNILCYDLIKEFENKGFRPIMQIQSPLTFNNQYAAHDVDTAKKESPWKMLPISREWHILKK